MQEAIVEEKPYPIKSLWLASYGFGTQAATFRDFRQQALPKLDLLVVSEQVMTAAARIADLVLPVTSYYEEELELVPGIENWWLQVRAQTIPPVGESKTDWDIFAGLFERMGHGDAWRMGPDEFYGRLFAEHPDPLVNAIDWERLKEEKVMRLDVPSPLVPWGDFTFPTPSGKLELYHEDMVEYGQHILPHLEPLEGHRSPKAAQFPLTMMTIHSVYSTHSQHFGLPNIDQYLAEPRLEVNPRDASKRDLQSDDLVRVYNDRGAFKVKIKITESVRPGSVNLPQGWTHEHFPEGHYTNVLHMTINEAQEKIWETNAALFDNLVEIEQVMA
jgi:molybdopterin-containing oxidoreductase family molybdopterin binding subunit